MIALYSTNFTSSTNTSYNPELNLASDMAQGSTFYIRDCFSSLNSCPTYLENHDNTNINSYYGNTVNAYILLNTQNLNPRYVGLPFA